MSLQEKIQADLKIALKARDKERAGAIRILLGEFQRLPEKTLGDDKVVSIVKKLIKSERELLAAKNEDHSEYITILEGYLPQMASEDEIRQWIEDNIDFSELNNAMQAMRPIMAHFGSGADGNVVKSILQKMV